jgi:hypothetical protein
LQIDIEFISDSDVEMLHISGDERTSEKDVTRVK